MKNYTVMNLIHSMTGYYYNSSERLEMYINSKIAFKQLHFKGRDRDLLLEDEINNLKIERNGMKRQYTKHISTLGRIYLCLLFMILVALSYCLISNPLSNGGLIFSIFNFSLSVLVLPTLLMAWILGFSKAGKGQRLAKRINTIEDFIQCDFQPISKNKPVQMDNTESTAKNALLSCITILHKNNIIDVVDREFLNIPYTTTNILYPLSQIQLATYLTSFIRKEKIKIKDNCTKKSLAKCISENMRLEEGANIDTKSFEVTFNRVLKSKNEDYKNLLSKYAICCNTDESLSLGLN